MTSVKLDRSSLLCNFLPNLVAGKAKNDLVGESSSPLQTTLHNHLHSGAQLHIFLCQV